MGKTTQMNAPSEQEVDRAIRRVSRAELERRWHLVRARLAQEHLEAVIVFSSEDYLGANVRWLTDRPTNFAYHSAIVFHADNLMTLIEHGTIGGHLHSDGGDPDYPGVGEVRTTAAFHSVSYTQRYEAEILVEVLRGRGYQRVGVAGLDAMPHGCVSALQAVPNLTMTDLTEFFERIRAAKSAEEIREIRATAAQQDLMFAKLLDTVRPGMRDIDVTALLIGEGRRLGSSQQVLFAGSAVPDHIPLPRMSHAQGRLIRPGDYLTVLIENNGPGGYYNELGRTLVFGRASADRLEGLAIACAAQADSVKRYRPGVPCAAIAAAHDDFRAANHLPPEGRLFAHGQGYAMVERPLIRADEQMALAAGMNIVTHPAIIDGGRFGFICDNHLVHVDRPAERLHQTEQRIFEIDI
jgi:Xaa-Pro aminopeptidase